MPGKSDEAIRVRAYEIWLAEGQPHGRDWDHWVMAVAEIEGIEPPMGKAAKPAAAKAPKLAKASKAAEPATAPAKSSPKAAAPAKPGKAASSKVTKAKGEPGPAPAPTEAGGNAAEATLAAEAAPEAGKTDAPKKPRASKSKATV